MLQVKLLGQFDIHTDGKRVVIPSRAGQSLFAFLLLSAGTAHRREKLAGLFWPETSDDNARHSLRQELWRLRKAISSPAPSGLDYLLSEELSITFNPKADYWLDVAQFERGIAADESSTELIRRLGLYQGELLPGFYDDWVVLERERIQAQFETRMQQLIRLLLAEQRWTAVLEWGERWIALGQTPEPAYRALMLAYASLGNRAKAVATFERCVEALDKEFGVEPGPETKCLYEELAKAEGRGLKDGTLGLPQISDLNFHPSPFIPHPLHDEPPAPGEPPFKGMQYFDEADADLFFGRERLTAKLVGRLRRAPSPAEAAEGWGGGRFLAVVVGASGSGKSSIVRAGVVPALKRGEPLADGTRPPKGSARWDIHIMTPTAHPLQALAATLTCESEAGPASAALTDALAREPRALYLYTRQRSAHNQRFGGNGGSQSGDSSRLVLVVDQFEELFTLCHDDFEREAFIDNLLTALTPAPMETVENGEGGLTLILTLRADFYGHLAQYPELRDAVAKQQEYIGPMSADELRRAIEEPARRSGWEFEPGLVDLILRDVGDEPGALPLLSHALLETWKRRRGRKLTLKGYGESGGVRGAIAQTAENVYQGLSSERQAIARNIFLRLTELGEGIQDTRRRAALSELVPPGGDSHSVREVLRLLTDARLITMGDDAASRTGHGSRLGANGGDAASHGTVEVAHEALIREWQRLREWLNQDREGLRLHRQLTEAAQEWELLDRDPGALYRGAHLAQANEWNLANQEPQGPARDLGAGRINELERAFLEASNALAEREQAEREAQRQRELEAARKLVETQGRAAVQLRRRAVLLTGAFMLAIVLAGIALFFGEQAGSNARSAQANAGAAEKAKGEADAQRLAAESERRMAVSRELAAVAISNLDVDPQRSLLLALQAVSETYSVDKTWTVEAENALHQAVQAARVSLSFSGHKEPIQSAVFSPDGKHVASSGYDATRVWDAFTGQQLLTLPGIWPFLTNITTSAAFSPDGLRLATLDASDTLTLLVRTWDSTSGKLQSTTSLSVTPEETSSNAFSRDLSRVATGQTDGTAKLWDMKTGQLILTLSGHNGAVLSVAFSSDGKHLATGGGDKIIKIWDVATGKELRTLNPNTNSNSLCYVNGVAFSPDGSHLAAALGDGTARVWDIATGKELFTLSGHTNSVGPITFSPDGTRLATGSADQRAIVWDASNGRELFAFVGHNNFVNSVAFSPDGQHLVTASEDGTAKDWDLSPGGEAFQVTTGPILAFAPSPDGRRFATSHPDNTVKVWDTATGELILTLMGHSAPVRGLAFNRDGSQLVTGSSDMTAKLWNVSTAPFGSAQDKLNPSTGSGQATGLATGKALLTFVGHTKGINGVAYSPSGTRIATAGADGTARVWDTATGKEVLTLGGFTYSINNVSFSPDGTRLATASSDSLVRVWDVSTGKLLAYQRGHASAVWDVQFSPDGKRLVSAGQDGTARVLETATGQGLLMLFTETNSVARAVFNADGTRIATASDDGTAKVWDAATGEELLTLYGHTQRLNGVAFSLDGSRLITSSEDGTVQTYLLRIQDLIRLARSRLTRSWTSGECEKFLHVEQCPPLP